MDAEAQAIAAWGILWLGLLGGIALIIWAVGAN